MVDFDDFIFPADRAHVGNLQSMHTNASHVTSQIGGCVFGHSKFEFAMIYGASAVGPFMDETNCSHK